LFADTYCLLTHIVCLRHILFADTYCLLVDTYCLLKYYSQCTYTVCAYSQCTYTVCASYIKHVVHLVGTYCLLHHNSKRTYTVYAYGVATISRLLKIICLFCRISSLLQGSFAKETCNFKKPTNRSYPILDKTR